MWLIWLMCFMLSMLLNIVNVAGLRHLLCSYYYLCPQLARPCPAGARTVGPCVHGAMAIMAGCLYSQPGAGAQFLSTHRPVDLPDPGLAQALAYSLDIQLGNIG